MARADGARRASYVVAGAVVVVALALAPPALAAPPPGPLDPSSSIAQYVEDIPTAAGPQAAGARPSPRGGGAGAAGDVGEAEAGDGAPRSLPGPVAAQLQEQGGEDAEKLEEVATSPEYGAPQDPPVETRLGDQDAGLPSAGSATADAVAGGGTPVTLLLALVGATTLAALAAVGVRAKRRRL